MTPLASRAAYRAPPAVLRSLFDAALAAVDPLHCVPPHLPPRPRGRTLVIGAGKASARMARAVEAAWDGPLSGLVVTRYGHEEHCKQIEIVQAGHPLPDASGASAARRMLDLAAGMGPDDLVIAVMSGGGSSLLTLPAPGLCVPDLRAINRALLASGAPIGDMNLVRRHLSSIKGGRLAHACGAAALWTLVVSDVPGDDPAVVASGPTVADQSEPRDALEILHRWRIAVPPPVLSVLAQPKAAAPACSGPREVRVIATAETALEAAAREAERQGLWVVNLGGKVEGEARDIARQHAALARRLQSECQPSALPPATEGGQGLVPLPDGAPAAASAGARPCLLLSGGETTVTVRGHGRGGRNAEYLLALALALDAAPGIHALACDTDGIDGMEDNAGGWIDPSSLERSRALGIDAEACLRDNDAHRFLHALDNLVVTGPTRTNVNDFRAVLIA